MSEKGSEGEERSEGVSKCFPSHLSGVGMRYHVDVSTVE